MGDWERQKVSSNFNCHLNQTSQRDSLSNQLSWPTTPTQILKRKKKKHQQVWWQHFHPFQNVTLDYFLPWIHKTQLLPYLCLLLSTETLSSHSQARLCARHCKGLRPPHPQLKAYSLWVASCNVPTLASNNAGRIRLLSFCDSFKNQ